MHHRLKQQSFLAAAQMFLGEGCRTAALSHARNGGTAGKSDSSLLPPCLFLSSASPHLPLATGFSTVLRFLWVNTALPWHSHNACEIQGVMQTHLNMQHLLPGFIMNR